MLTVNGLTKAFGDRVALDHVSLEVDDGETLAVLGPSGCGKSTLLRVVAGLTLPDAGTIAWDGQDLAAVPTHLRRFGLMFQGYALFPHRNVADNVAFGLRMQDMDPPQVDRRVAEVLDWVGLTGFERRAVTSLSGGEQQRVALARTLAPSPRLIMLDEPLSSLDRNLRDRLRTEIADLLERNTTAAIYVTHDHGEAEAVGDRVALMQAGKVVQVGAFDALRDQPADEWVAEFLGGG
ncbi:MAG TPA: ABC transporter ATP-binding protein [Acidimicrobiia bacterium]